MSVKRVLTFVLALVMAFSLLPASFAAQQPAVGEPVVTILHTNDVHGYYEHAGNAIGHDYVAAFRDKMVEERGDSVLLLSAGDAVQGVVFANLSRGESAVKVMNATGYEAMTMGNHEFDYGFARLKELAAMAEFPFLLSESLSGEAENFKEYVVIEKNGYKVGIFGLTTPETAYKTNPLGIPNMDFGDKDSLIADATRLVATLRDEEAVDFVVALAHLGIEDAGLGTSTDIAEAVDGIDVIIDGHSHTVMDGGEVVGNTIVTSTGSQGANIGVVELYLEEGSTPEVKCSLVKLEGVADLTPNSEVTEVIASWKAEVDKTKENVVATISADVTIARANERTRETEMGNIVADALRYVTGAQVSLVNGGGIRDHEIKAGPITQNDVLTILPFGNAVRYAEVKGSVIKEALENGVSVYPTPNGGFSQVSGLYFSFNPTVPAGSRVTNITIDGKPLDPDLEYKFATVDFLADGGGDNYTMLIEPFKANSLNIENSEVTTLDEILAYYLSENPEVIPAIENRIVVDISFSDLEHGSREEEIVVALALEGILRGYPNGTFLPDADVSRAEFAAIVTRCLNLPAPADKSKFPDVLETDWFADPVYACVEAGLILGNEDGTFAPDATITFEQMGLILERALETENDYTDANRNATRIDVAIAIHDLLYVKPLNLGAVAEPVEEVVEAEEVTEADTEEVTAETEEAVEEEATEETGEVTEEELTEETEETEGEVIEKIAA